MSRSRKTLAAALSPVAFALLLTACGGGGGGSGAPMASNDPAPAPDPAPTPPVAMPEPEPTPPTPTPAPAPDPAPTPPVAMPEPEPTPPTPTPAPAPDPAPTPPVAMPEPEPTTPTPLPDPALLAGEEVAKAMAAGSLPLPSEHGVASGRIEIAAGRYEDRNGLRFSCTGSEPCVVAVEGGQARVVAGEVRLARLMDSGPTPANPPVAMPEPDPEPTPAAAQIQLPADHEMKEDSSGTIAAGDTSNRRNVRFTCAAGGERCRYSYIGDDQIRATGGTLTVEPVPWPVYLIMDAARLTSLLGGSVLDWGDGEALREVRTRLIADDNYDSRFGPTRADPDSRHTADAFSGKELGTTRLHYDEDGNLVAPASGGVFHGEWHDGHLWLSSPYRHRAEELITDEDGITYVQVVMKDDLYPDAGSGEDYPEFTLVFGGLLEYADFWVTEATEPWSGGTTFDGPKHGAFYRTYHPDYSGDNNPIEATWNGKLIGIGHNKAFPDLYRQAITGLVNIETDLGYQGDDLDSVTFEVELTGVKKVSTGETVSLSTTEWQSTSNTSRYLFGTGFSIDPDGTLRIIEGDIGGGSRAWTEGDSLGMAFGGPGFSTAAGVFQTREAIGSFGAKKEE